MVATLPRPVQRRRCRKARALARLPQVSIEHHARDRLREWSKYTHRQAGSRQAFMRSQAPEATASATPASTMASAASTGPVARGHQPGAVARHVDHERQVTGEALEVAPGLGIGALGRDRPPVFAWLTVVGRDERSEALAEHEGAPVGVGRDASAPRQEASLGEPGRQRQRGWRSRRSPARCSGC